MGLDADLDAAVAGGLTGAVAVAAGPGFRWEGASGVADVSTGEALTQEHRFRIASVTKTFVAALVLQLVEEGVFELDAEAGPLAEGATVRQLLNHTAGFPNIWDDVIAMFEPYRRDLGAPNGAGRGRDARRGQGKAAPVSRPARAGRTPAATSRSSG